MKNITRLTMLLIPLLFLGSNNATAGDNDGKLTNPAGSYTLQPDGLYTIPEFKAIKLDGGLLIGFRLMPTMTSFQIDEDDETITASSKLGYGIGGLLGVNINDHVGIQLEAIYSALAQEYTHGNYVADIELKYINFPLMVVLNTNYSSPVNLNLAIGPQLGLNVGSDLNVDQGNDSASATLAVKKSDFGFAYGAGLDFGLSGMKLNVGFRGVFGLVNISSGSSTQQTNEYYILEKTNINTYSIYVGLTFGG